MKQKNRFIFDMLDQDLPSAKDETIYRAGECSSVKVDGKDVLLTVPFYKQEMKNLFLYRDKNAEPLTPKVRVRGYGKSIIRFSLDFGNSTFTDATNPMLQMDLSLKQDALSIKSENGNYIIVDDDEKVRVRFDKDTEQREIWSTLQPEPDDVFMASVFPDGNVEVPFMGRDNFFPHQSESYSLGFVKKDNNVDRWLYSLHAEHDEKFAGTGERFAGMNLSGKTFVMENTDGLGNNSRRSYKNIPFYISSRGYGLLILTPGHVRMSLADISTRAAQSLVEDDNLDFFIIGGGSVERILYNYRRLTGFPSRVPLWSYGTWMAKMTYFSAEETRTVVNKMREGHFPLDVIHLDTGWFAKDWKCEWQFSNERFPNPESYLKEMADEGIRISLWQLPSIAKGTKYYEVARDNRYFAPKSDKVALGSNFSEVEFDGNIDFTNPEAVKWYKGLLTDLLKMGVSCIKTDFGEVIDESADYQGLPYRKLHNLYSMLYQKAAFEASVAERGNGNAMVWARAGWVGSQRYPIHWSGDCACSWDGMAGALRGGLHLGLSGFGFWSHDVPGFHGVPSFMNSKPTDDLYVRWTQMGVFSSHLRYHGTNVREPYEYPAIQDIVREWLKLRYALIPYLDEQGIIATNTGYPVLRALVFHHADDPMCWTIDDEFYCGDDFLVCPVMNSTGVRSVYLPEGEWVDFWTGERLVGGKWIKNIQCVLNKLPVFVKHNAIIPVYTEEVQCTDEMKAEKVANLTFDESYIGFDFCVLGKYINIK